MTQGSDSTGTLLGKGLSLWPLGIVFLILGFAIFGERGLLHLHKMTVQKTALMNELAEVEARNEALREQIIRLRGDRTYIERLARTELGMVRDDELVFQFTDTAQGGSPR
ncbi:MAG: septum formation initiator family protein [Desulfuromonadales bacterium]|nr:septum formation initiator family protein [Desulfuromonadales bacterium]